MPIQIVCPHCGAKGNAPDSIAGQQVRCSKCKSAFTAQTPASAPAPIAASSFGFDEPAAPLAVDDDEPAVSIRSPRIPSSSGGFGSFIMFRSFGGRFLVFIYFWVMLVIVLVSAGMTILGALALFQISARAAIVPLLIGLVELIIGPLLVRLSGEVMAVMFQMNERLGEISELLRRDRK